jgi:hypothetical protein
MVLPASEGDREMIDITRDVRIDDAAEILEAQCIGFFLVDSRDDAAGEWTALAREHGERIAVAQQRGDELIVSWHYDHKPIAWKIRCAFRAAGMRATWDGEIWNAVHVDLAATRPAK